MGREPKIFRLLFSDDMARAVVEGRKTVTRRPIAPQPVIPPDVGQHLAPGETLSMLVNESWQSGFVDVRAPCAPGDILIGRQCWAHLAQDPEVEYIGDLPHGGTVEYRADHNPPLRKPGGWDDAEPGDPDMVHWRPSIHMPDWAARIRRRVVSITVERLHDISEADAVREGFNADEELARSSGNHVAMWAKSARWRFAQAWDAIYAAKGLGWAVNPWVWRIEFSAENVPPA